MSGIRSQAGWTFAGTCFAAVIQVIQLSIVARHLSAHELGVLSIVNALLLVAMVLQDMGMSSYLVHRQDITRRQQSTVYWVNVGISIFTGLLILAVAKPIGWFYKLPELGNYLMLASANFMILGHLSQYQAHYIKSKRLVLIAKVEMVSRTFAFLCTVYLVAVVHIGVPSVILGLFSGALLKLLVLWAIGDKEWRPTFEFDKAAFKGAMKYGVYQFGSQIINQLRTQADTLIVGKVLGAGTLGVYSLAKDLILQPLKLISPVVNRLALPRFAEKQHSRPDVQQLFLKGVFVITLASGVLYFVIGLFSRFIVNVMYGQAHMQVADIMVLMLLFGMLRPMGGLTGAISQANGRTSVEFYWNIVASLIMAVILSMIFVFPELTYIGLSLSIAQIFISIFAHHFFIKPVVGVSLRAYTKQWMPVAAIFILLMCIVVKFDLFIPGDVLHRIGLDFPRH